VVEQVRHLTLEELEAALDLIRQSPRDSGMLEMIVRRPAIDVREALSEGMLDLTQGLVGDSWIQRGSSSTPDGRAHPGRQLTLMNRRVAALVAQTRDRWALAGDQLFVDLDLSEEMLAPGARLQVGGAVIEVTDQPHTGCKKFAERFGLDALKFVSTPSAKALRLRGLYARVMQPGTIRVGEPVIRL
jgi:MOSC domain-containing protein YiiM